MVRLDYSGFNNRRGTPFIYNNWFFGKCKECLSFWALICGVKLSIKEDKQISIPWKILKLDLHIMFLLLISLTGRNHAIERYFAQLYSLHTIVTIGFYCITANRLTPPAWMVCGLLLLFATHHIKMGTRLYLCWYDTGTSIAPPIVKPFASVFVLINSWSIPRIGYLMVLREYKCVQTDILLLCSVASWSDMTLWDILCYGTATQKMQIPEEIKVGQSGHAPL